MNTYSKRLANTFSQLGAENKKALIPFITTGDPQGILVHEIMHALVEGGADVIELGIPFSDPAADGPVIQLAGERAIADGIGLHDCLLAVKKFRETDQKTPIILMGYLNSAEAFEEGFSGFCKALSTAEADGVILVDLSYESGVNNRKMLRASNIDLVNLIAPTTSKTRLAKIVKNAGGFVYYVSMRGTTGNGNDLNLSEIEAAVTAVKSKTELPVCIGFGISDAETAKKMSAYADGVVVGSALVKKLYNAAQENKDVLAEATEFMRSLRQSIDN
ncbi:MAG: tryptophan synthase subunit alpha [Gammaproteobacteria bacterium]|nr:tryptophan synthase subunit alpha [Gammaproteobacteria bacterium]